MIPLTLAEITAITSGTLHHAPDPSAQVTGPAACDSRQVTRGGMFASTGSSRSSPVTYTTAGPTPYQVAAVISPPEFKVIAC